MTRTREPEHDGLAILESDPGPWDPALLDRFTDFREIVDVDFERRTGRGRHRPMPEQKAARGGWALPGGLVAAAAIAVSYLFLPADASPVPASSSSSPAVELHTVQRYDQTWAVQPQGNGSSCPVVDMRAYSSTGIPLTCVLTDGVLRWSD